MSTGGLFGSDPILRANYGLAVSDIIRQSLTAAGAGAGIRGLQELLRRRQPAQPEQPSPLGPIVIDMPVLDEEEEQPKQQKKIALLNFEPSTRLALPGVGAASLMLPIGAAALGWKSLDKMLDERRRKALDQETTEAEEAYRRALLQDRMTARIDMLPKSAQVMQKLEDLFEHLTSKEATVRTPLTPIVAGMQKRINDAGAQRRESQSAARAKAQADRTSHQEEFRGETQRMIGAAGRRGKPQVAQPPSPAAAVKLSPQQVEAKKRLGQANEYGSRYQSVGTPVNTKPLAAAPADGIPRARLEEKIKAITGNIGRLNQNQGRGSRVRGQVMVQERQLAEYQRALAAMNQPGAQQTPVAAAPPAAPAATPVAATAPPPRVMAPPVAGEAPATPPSEVPPASVATTPPIAETQQRLQSSGMGNGFGPTQPTPTPLASAETLSTGMPTPAPTTSAVSSTLSAPTPAPPQAFFSVPPVAPPQRLAPGPASQPDTNALAVDYNPGSTSAGITGVRYPAAPPAYPTPAANISPLAVRSPAPRMSAGARSAFQSTMPKLNPQMFGTGMGWGSHKPTTAAPMPMQQFSPLFKGPQPAPGAPRPTPSINPGGMNQANAGGMGKIPQLGGGGGGLGGGGAAPSSGNSAFSTSSFGTKQATTGDVLGVGGNFLLGSTLLGSLLAGGAGYRAGVARSPQALAASAAKARLRSQLQRQAPEIYARAVRIPTTVPGKDEEEEQTQIVSSVPASP